MASGCSPMEVTSALTSMQVELGMVKNVPSENLEGAAPQKSPWLADAHGNPVDFTVTGGEVYDAKAALHLINRITVAANFIADKGYDSEAIREQVRHAGMNPVIPRKSNSRKPNPEFDRHLYKQRHLVENLFARLKHFRSIATRFEKLARNFKAILFLAGTFIWPKLN